MNRTSIERAAIRGLVGWSFRHPIVLWLHDRQKNYFMFAAERENIPGRNFPVYFFIKVLTNENKRVNINLSAREHNHSGPQKEIIQMTQITFGTKLNLFAVTGAKLTVTVVEHEGRVNLSFDDMFMFDWGFETIEAMVNGIGLMNYYNGFEVVAAEAKTIRDKMVQMFGDKISIRNKQVEKLIDLPFKEVKEHIPGYIYTFPTGQKYRVEGAEFDLWIRAMQMKNGTWRIVKN